MEKAIDLIGFYQKKRFIESVENDYGLAWDAGLVHTNGSRDHKVVLQAQMERLDGAVPTIDVRWYAPWGPSCSTLSRYSPIIHHCPTASLPSKSLSDLGDENAQGTVARTRDASTVAPNNELSSLLVRQPPRKRRKLDVADLAV